MRSRLFTPGDIEIEPALAYLASLPESKTTLPHHNNVTEDSLYRDGVTLRAEHWSTKHRLVNVGFNDGILASIPDAFPKRVRLAVRLTSLVPAEGERSIPATIVSPTEAREELGQYMGFTISTTPSLASMFEECPFEGGYDLSILMSDAGEAGVGQLSTPDTLSAMNYLIVFADSEKLDILAGADKQLQELEIDTPAQLFDHAVDLTKITDNPEILETAVDMVNGGLHALSSFLAMRLEQ